MYVKLEAMTKPILTVFTISHYCEKARWGLDYLGIDYQLQVVTAGTHLKIAKELGLENSAVPFLETEQGVIQGSDAILDWAEENSVSARSRLSSSETIRSIEQRLDQRLGIHVRRWFYSEAIVEHPSIVRPVFTKDISLWEQAKFSIKWPVIKKLMIQKMDLGYEQGQESFDIVKSEIEWLESMLSDNGNFLTGETFSRADITAASLLAPIVNPQEHPCFDLLSLPPRAQEQYLQISDYAIWAWIIDVYAKYRRQ